MSKEFPHKGGKCGNGAETSKNDSITEFPALPPPPYIRRQRSVRVVRRHCGPPNLQFSPVPILHPIQVIPVPSPSHDYNLDARIPFERAQSRSLPLSPSSLKSPLIYITAKTEKKSRPCRPTLASGRSVQPSATEERRER